MAYVHLFVVVAVASTLLMSTDAATYNVGGSTGWTNPSSTTFYSDWTSGKNFSLGDVLVFTFSTQHDLYTVDESDYSGCTSSNTIASTRTSPASITLNTTGMHYYICTTINHCPSGQKLAVNVSGSGTSNNGTTSSSPPPPPGSGATETVASFFLVCFSFVIGLFSL